MNAAACAKALGVPITDEMVHEAIEIILADHKAKFRKSLNYAIGYCNAGLFMHGHALKVQVLYILNNITGWRHPRAKAVRQVLKAYGKQ